MVIVPKDEAESQSALSAGQENQENTTMREQLHLPERYQASFEEGGLSFFADAEISIPDDFNLGEEDGSGLLLDGGV